MSASDRPVRNLRRAHAAIGCGALAAFLSLASVAQAGEASVQLLASFQALCMAAPLDMAQSEKKAAELQLSLEQSIGGAPNEEGFYARTKSWSVVATTPHEFIVSDTHGPKGDMKSCAIRALTADSADFQAELIKAMKLGKPSTQTVSPDGMNRYTAWTLGDRTLTLSDKTPQNQKQGVRLIISTKPL